MITRTRETDWLQGDATVRTMLRASAATRVKMASTIWTSPIRRGVKVWFIKEITLILVLEDQV